MITRSVVVNKEISSYIDNSDNFIPLFQAAEKTRQDILDNYLNNKIERINPLVLVQLPDDSTESLSLSIQKYIQESMNKTYDNGKLGIWLSNEKRNIDNVEDLNNSVEYLIIKQAIATGWDAPRAKILIKIRENMGEKFTIQTLGRIRRMPEPYKGHYNNDILDNSYLYTFDTDFLDGVFSESNSLELTPILYLKKSAIDLKLESERSLDNNELINEKSVLINIYNGLKEKFNFSKDYISNKHILENYGYVMGDKILTTYKYGRFDTLDNSKELKDSEWWIEVDPKKTE